MPSGRILSSDPDAGLSSEQRKRILSSDPNAGVDDSSLADWLPAVGGVVGGAVGTAGGPLGTAAGAALGGAGGEGFRQIIRRVQGKSAPESMTDAATDIGVTGALEGAVGLAGGAILKGGSRLIRGVSKYAVPGANAAIDWMPGTVGRAARGVRTISRGFGGAAEKPSVMAKGFDRWMPNTSAAQSRPMPASKLPSGLTPRVLSEGEERGVANLDELLDVIHGPDRAMRGNGMLPAATTAPRQQLARELMRSEAADKSVTPIAKVARTMDDVNADLRADTQRLRAFRESIPDPDVQAARHAEELEYLRKLSVPNPNTEQLGGRLTKAGLSMLDEEEQSMFANALRELRSGSLNRAQSVQPWMGRR